MGYCKKHGEYSVLCTDCDLELIDEYKETGKVAPTNEALYDVIDKLENQCILYEAVIEAHEIKERCLLERLERLSSLCNGTNEIY